MFFDGFQVLTTMNLGLISLGSGWMRNFLLLAGVLVIGKCISFAFVFIPGGNLRRFLLFYLEKTLIAPFNQMQRNAVLVAR